MPDLSQSPIFTTYRVGQIRRNKYILSEELIGRIHDELSGDLRAMGYI